MNVLWMKEIGNRLVQSKTVAALNDRFVMDEEVWDRDLETWYTQEVRNMTEQTYGKNGLKTLVNHFENVKNPLL